MSWWAERWRTACLSEMIDPNPQVNPGMALAAKGRATVIHVEPALVRAIVRDRRDYAVTVGVRQLAPHVFESVAAYLAGVPMLCAAVLTGELPIEVDGMLLDRGVSLVPDATEVLAECECDEYHSPCRHGVAALMSVADLLDADPFTLTLLRGSSRDQIVAGVRSSRGLTRAGEQSDEPRGSDPGAPAAAAFRRTVSTVVPSGLPPRAAVPPGRLIPPPPLDSGLSSSELQALLLDASQRAVQLLRGDGDGSLRQSVEADLARRAAAAVEAGSSLVSLSAAAGISEDELREQARCWGIGGPAALAVRVSSWSADSGRLAPGRQLFDPPGRISRNIVSSGDIQLRLDPDGLWWRFIAHPTRGWLLDSAGFEHPADALDDQL